MNDEAREWLAYAEENFQAAEVLHEERLYNPSLQNSQQAVEKALKAVLVQIGVPIKRTHSIHHLVTLIAPFSETVPLEEEDCEFLDSIYLPSKYPLGGVLPDFEPDFDLSERCLNLSRSVIEFVRLRLESTKVGPDDSDGDVGGEFPDHA